MIDTANIRAIILDFDGLLIDTTLYSCKEWRGIFELYGVTLDDDEYAELMHLTPDQMLDHLEGVSNICIPDQTRQSLTGTRQGNIDIAVRKNGLKPGAVALLLACKKAGIPVAIASNTPAHILTARTHALGITAKHRPAIVGMDGHHTPKPAPDILLTAAQQLGIHPAHCLAVDNDPEHAAAAVTAGMQAAIIPDAITRHLPAGDITTLSSLYVLAALIDDRPAPEETHCDLPNPFADIPAQRPAGTLPPPQKRRRRRIII